MDPRKAYFVVLRRTGPQWDPSRPLEEQSGWPAHASFMDGLVDAGFVVLGGPLADEHRVVLVVEAESEDAVRSTLARDPWSETHLRVDTIDRWTIRLDGRRAQQHAMGGPGMRDLIVTENITLDGVIDASAGWFSVVDEAEVDQSDLVAALREQSEAADAVVFGRVTFEEMRGYWPKQTDDTTGVTDYLNRVSKYVVSSTMGDPQWEHTTVLPGDAFLDELRALKAKPGKDIVTTGSITLVHALIAAGLVDEYRLFVYPVVLGRGARLFADATEVPRLRLVETRPFRSGIVLLRYRGASR